MYLSSIYPQFSRTEQLYALRQDLMFNGQYACGERIRGIPFQNGHASLHDDAAVIDLLMAGAMIGEGTSYPNLTYTVNLNEANGEEDENYVVGFRKGSDLTEAFNNFYKGAYKDGVVLSFAQKYGVQEAIVDPEA